MKAIIFKLRCLLAIATVMFTAVANAATYYVATNGSDGNPGTIAQPFRTISKGTSVLRSGDTLYIRGGTYDAIIGGYDIPGGSPSQPTVIAGYGSENPIIRCTNNCVPHYTVVTLFNTHITLQDFTIDVINGGAGSGCAYLPANILFLRMTCLNAARDGVRVTGQNTIIRNSHIKDCGRNTGIFTDTKGLGIYANSDGPAQPGDGSSNTSGLLIEGNLIEGCRAGGIGVQVQRDTRNVIVRNNILRNFGTYSPWPQAQGATPQSGTGINFGHGSYYYAYNNLIYRVRGPESDCFLTWGGGGFYYIYNNTCVDTDIGIVMSNESNNVTARNNIFSNVNQVAILGNGVNNTNSNYVTNPNFVNVSANDFRLRSGSPGIDQGADVSTVVTKDFNGSSRPQGCCYDIGAYEYVVSGTSSSTPSPPSNLQIIP